MATPVTKQQWLDCVDAAGNPLPVHICNGYRVRHGYEPLPEPQRINVQQRTPDHKEIPHSVRPRPPGLDGGPGTELKKLLHSLGITNAWCEGCKNRAATMDRLGVEGCRREIDTIAGWLKEAAAKQSASTKLMAGWKAAWSQTWINPLRPYHSLVERAIEAAEARSLVAIQQADNPVE